MSALFVVVPLAIVISGLAVAAFVWAARSGQFDDLETPAWRALSGDPASQSQEEPASGLLTPSTRRKT
jgi:cbb3-type cytochrome oxidase maturation protein